MPVPGFVYSPPYYPYATGYADIASVKRRIAAGAWDPSLPNQYPTEADVNAFLIEGTSLVDSALGPRGYTIPLTARPGYVVPPGVTPINGLHPSLYAHLEMVVAHYAVACIQKARHSAGISMALEHGYHDDLHLFNDYITRLETGADNLTMWGAAGPFTPEIDPGQGIQTGSVGAFVSSGAPDPTQEGPLFTKNMIF